MNKRIPVTIITGFLGSGKTTLIRNILQNSNLKLAIMMNEFGDVGLDGDLIKTCGFCSEDELDGRIVELNNGCLCCTVQDDFLPSIQRLLNNSLQLDGILIETSGLALPQPLLQALEWPEIKSKIFLNCVITLVDSEALSLGSPVGDLLALKKQQLADQSLDHMTPINDLFNDQLLAADIILLSRSDLVTKKQSVTIQQDILSRASLNTKVIPISNGNFDARIILDSYKTVELNKESESQYKFELTSNEHEHEHEHEHINVISSAIRIELNAEQTGLEKLFKSLSNKYQILRLKGRLWQKDKALPLQIQMVGSRLSTWYEAAPEDSWRPETEGLELVILSLRDGVKNELLEELTHLESN